MSVITGSKDSRQLERADQARSQTKKDPVNHHGGHSMMRHMLLCGLAMVTAVVISAASGINIAPLFSAAMMIGMVWMMAAPAVAKLRNRDHASQWRHGTPARARERAPELPGKGA